MSLQKTAAEALGDMNAFKRRGWSWPCVHPTVEDGFCERCGQPVDGSTEGDK